MQGNRYSKPTKAEVWHRIDENCKTCIYDPHADGNWVQQVEACDSVDCPMWAIRRVSRPKTGAKRPAEVVHA